MKFSVRRNVFETNSSSTHSITMCTKSDYDKWKKGELIWDSYEDKLVPIPEGYREYDEEEEIDYKYDQYYTYDRFEEQEYIFFSKTHTTSSGEKIIAFGYYGYN